MWRIERVRPVDYPRAVVLLASGADAARRRPAFTAMLTGPDAGRCDLWWARGALGARAAAMTVRNAGRSALVFHSPPRRGADVEALAGVLGEATDAALAAGATFVQALLAPGAAGAEAHLRAGYEYLTNLIYLRRRLDAPPAEEALKLTWAPLGDRGERELGRVIADTYVDSQDCPALLGRRRMEDVVAAHKANGVFRPESWLLPSLAGECVGCVLVNDSAGRADEAEVIYLGVRPAWRRRGIARAMLRRAMNQAAGRGRKTMSLAVDAANAAAVRLYESEGFREVDRKDVYARLPEPATGPPG